MIQGGDPTGTGRGGSSIYGEKVRLVFQNSFRVHSLQTNVDLTSHSIFTSALFSQFADEISAELRFTGAGILAMANAGPNTNGSQFFLTLAPTPFLDRKHTIFGRVKEGMKVVQKLGLVATDSNDR